MRLGFWCENCERFYGPADDIAKAALEGDDARCPRCLSLDWPRKNLTVRAKRKDATRPGKYTDARTSKPHARPQRQTKTPQRLDDYIVDSLPLRGGVKRARDQASGDDDRVEIEEGDGRPPSKRQRLDDAEYLPARPFNIKMRFTAGGSFSVTSLRKMIETKKVVPWTQITKSPGRGNPKKLFGESATHYARKHLTNDEKRQLGRKMKFEWCHMVADSLGGATAQSNMFCATKHANTAMACIERELQGKTHLEVRVEVDIRKDTKHLGEYIHYYIREADQLSCFEVTIDALATGCTEKDGNDLAHKVRKWLRRHSL